MVVVHPYFSSVYNGQLTRNSALKPAHFIVIILGRVNPIIFISIILLYIYLINPFNKLIQGLFVKGIPTYKGLYLIQFNSLFSLIPAFYFKR